MENLPQQQFTEAQQERIDKFAQGLEEMKKDLGCIIMPSIILEPTGAKYVIRIIPEEVINPRVQPANGVIPDPNMGVGGV